MATLPNNKFFNISDTNYLGVGFGDSDAMAQGINKLTADNSAMFQMYGQQAIAMANQRSSNFQKFGSLFKEAAVAKNAIDQWRQASEEDDYGKPDKDDKDEKEKPKKPEGGGEEGGEEGDGKTEKPPEVKKDRYDHIKLKKAEVDLNYNAFKNAEENSANVSVNEEAVLTTNLTKADTFEEASRLNSKTLVDMYNGYINNQYSNFSAPPSLYGGQPGDPNYTLEQLVNNGMVREAALLKQNLRKSFNITTGMYNRGSKNFLGFNRRKAVIKQQNAIDDKYYGTFLTKKLGENQKDIEYKRRSTLLASFADKTIPASETISEYIQIYEGETGVKDNPRVFRKLYEDVEYLVEKSMITTTDLNAIENAIMTHRSSGEKMKLSDLNANSRAFVTQIRGLNLKAGRQELLNREAEKANEIAIDVDAEIAKLNQVVNNPDGMPSKADRNKALVALSAKHNIPIGDKRLDTLRKHLVWEEKDDQQTYIKFIEDLQKNPLDVLNNLSIRLGEFNSGSIRKQALDEAKKVNGLETHKKTVSDYEGLVDADIRSLFGDAGKTKTLHVDDLKDVQLSAKQYFRNEFLKALPAASSAEDAAATALAKVKAISNAKGIDGLRIDYKDTVFYKRSQPRSAKSQMDRDLLKTLREVNANPVQMLNSTEYWKGEDIGAAKQALDYINNVPGATFPVYYAKIANDLPGYSSHELMLMRLDKLGMLPKDVKVTSVEKDNINNSNTLEKFLYKPTNGRTIRGFFELGENTDWYYESNHSRYAYLRSDLPDERYNSIDSGKNLTNITNLQELTFPQVIAAWDNGYGHKSGLGAFGFNKAQLLSLVPNEGEEFGDLDFQNGKFDAKFQKKAFDALQDRQLYNDKMFYGLDPSYNSQFNVAEDFAESIGLNVDYFKGVNQPKYINFTLFEELMNEEL
tara:strand:+ start:1642 stop:4389 length:2748 start_codon:yes stop_codon:yes gene_type:complete